MLGRSIGYFIALLLTMGVEAIIASLFGFGSVSEILLILLVSLLANQIVNVYLFFSKYSDILKAKAAVIFLLEAIVVFITFGLLILILRQNPERLLALSIILTLFSYLAGAYLFPRLTSSLDQPNRD